MCSYSTEVMESEGAVREGVLGKMKLQKSPPEQGSEANKTTSK